MMIFVRFFCIALFFLTLLSPLNAQEKVFPKNGDGITSLLRRYNRTDVQYHVQFLEINKDRLGKNNSLIKGKAYILPPLMKNGNKLTLDAPAKKKEGHEPLFGSALANYPIESSELEGATFYVVSGHGGPDPGAIARFENHTLCEDEYAYDIALRLARYLLMKGATVHIIIRDPKDGIRDDRLLTNSKRETCLGVAIPAGHVARLQQRSDAINDLDRQDKNKYSRAIFIHIDSRNKDKKLDVFFYHSTSEASKKLARTMRSTFDKKYAYHQPNRGFTGTVSGRNLYVLENTTPVALYVELANIQNVLDLRRIIQKDNRDALAKWMCEGFVMDYKLLSP